MIEKDIKERLVPAWRFEGYWVDCEKGEVYSTKRGKLKKMSLNNKKTGYLTASLYNKGNQKDLLMQRLVYSSYYQCDIPDEMHVDHIDNDRKNNSISNLQLLTPRDNVRKALLGKKLSEEHKAKLSKIHKGQVPWIKGKKHTEETKARISKANLGRKKSEETKVRMSAARRKMINITIVYNGKTLSFDNSEEIDKYFNKKRDWFRTMRCRAKKRGLNYITMQNGDKVIFSE